MKYGSWRHPLLIVSQCYYGTPYCLISRTQTVADIHMLLASIPYPAVQHYILIRIPEVPGSNLGPVTGYPEVFRGVPQSLQPNAGIVP
jgi:hypothetical protein